MLVFNIVGFFQPKKKMRSNIILSLIYFMFVASLLIQTTTQIGPLLKNSKCRNTYNGTTHNIEQIFLGRCFYFLNILQLSNCNLNDTVYDCNSIWTVFQSVVVGKDPCDLKISDFDDLLKMVDHYIAPNTSLFWSGTYTPAHDSKYYRLFCYLFFKKEVATCRQ